MSKKGKKPPKQKNTHLIVLAAVSGLVASLLFLDAFVPILPDSVTLGGGHPEGEENLGEMDEDETKKHWWDGIFDRNHPIETVPPAEDDFSWTEDRYEPIPRPLPTPAVSVFYTEEEMIEAYYDYVVTALRSLARMEKSGQVLPISEVGLFNVDTYGMPEIILRHEMEGGQAEYTVYEMISMELLTSCEGHAVDLTLWQRNDGGYSALFSHNGDGNDDCIREIISYGTDCVERLAELHNGSTVTYRVEGKWVAENEYYNALSEFQGFYTKLGETGLVTVPWESADSKSMAKTILSCGQKFVRTPDTQP